MRSHEQRPPARFPGRLAVAVAAAAALLAGLTGCGQDEPVADPAEDQAPSLGGTSNEEFRNLLDECLVVPPDQIVEVFDAQALDNTFYGAICRFTVLGAAVPTSVTLAWFENSSLWHERRATERLGYDIENATVAGQGGFIVRIPDDPAACGVATRAGEGGTLIWWVHPHSRSGGDGCAAAMELAELTVRTHF
ncbi:DUF3558 domain-containing protein [Lolliginicoccus levis]|uniref:DUF3558 domain-containing protein n=1 Tax=Lolliginicoccus levis TaxID=2919542 RepID=UPI00241BF01C|nr:DUF3558 domain-containing protein [Lolliginicoccus levis]